jgi:hypothetical protein
MNVFAKELIGKLQAEIEERQAVIDTLKNGNMPAGKKTEKTGSRGWSPAQHRKFQTTMKKARAERETKQKAKAA